MDGASNWNTWTLLHCPCRTTTEASRPSRLTATGCSSPDEDIYFYDFDNAAWSLSYQPEGTQINVMYYDELLVGTGTGSMRTGCLTMRSLGCWNRRHPCPNRWLPFRPSPIHRATPGDAGTGAPRRSGHSRLDRPRMVSARGAPDSIGFGTASCRTLHASICTRRAQRPRTTKRPI